MTSRRPVVALVVGFAIVAVGMILLPLRPAFAVDWWRLTLPVAGFAVGYYAGRTYYHRHPGCRWCGHVRRRHTRGRACRSCVYECVGYVADPIDPEHYP